MRRYVDVSRLAEAAHDPAVAGVLLVGIRLDLENHPVDALPRHIIHEYSGVTGPSICVRQEYEPGPVGDRLAVVNYILYDGLTGVVALLEDHDSDIICLLGAVEVVFGDSAHDHS